MSFEANVGQSDPDVAFITRGNNYSLFLTNTDAVLSMTGTSESGDSMSAVVSMQFVGANAAPEIVGIEELSGKSNYILGNDPLAWHLDVPNYGAVEYEEIYAGIDVVYTSNSQRLQYDFVVAAGANPNNIRLNFDGADGISINGQGELVLSTMAGELVHQAPFIYQDIDGVRRQVSGGFVLNENNQVGFAVGEYDTSKVLVIDPTLVYSTFLGGSQSDKANNIVVDAAGNAYVTGISNSGFPETNSIGNSGGSELFITKLNSTGGLVYSTTIGGSGDEEGRGIAIDAAGNAYVAGYSESNNFPLLNPFDNSQSNRDAFVLKLNAAGNALLYSSFFGGTGIDDARDIAVSTAGIAYITGYTESDSQASAGAVDTTRSGRDAFVAAFNPTLSGAASRIYSTYLGGSTVDEGFGIAVDSAGNAHVTGFTDSSDFNTTVGAFDTSHNGGRDVFITKLNATGTARLYSTFLGGGSADEGRNVALDAAGNAYVAGITESNAGIASAGAFDTSLNGGRDIFVAKLNSTGSTPHIRHLSRRQRHRRSARNCGGRIGQCAHHWLLRIDQLPDSRCPRH